MSDNRSEILRQKAREIRALAANADTANIRELLDHLAQRCERLAEQLARQRY